MVKRFKLSVWSWKRFVCDIDAEKKSRYPQYDAEHWLAWQESSAVSRRDWQVGTKMEYFTQNLEENYVHFEQNIKPCDEITVQSDN